jgi:hypothetical protein
MTHPMVTWTVMAALAGTVTAAADPRPTVVELFTSQGCNPCPPADALLGELAARGDVLALAYHVDYWDELGWRDRFGLPQAVQRQSQYARLLGLASVYTPQLVIDGHDDVLGSDRTRIVRLLSTPRRGVPVTAQVRGHDLVVESAAVPGAAPCDVLVVSFLPETTTAISRGENSGRTLREYNVVRSIRTIGRWPASTATWRLELNSFPADARFVAVLLQEQATGSIVGAARVPLPR